MCIRLTLHGTNVVVPEPGLSTMTFQLAPMLVMVSKSVPGILPLELASTQTSVGLGLRRGDIHG